jgi:hypothetical protein
MAIWRIVPHDPLAPMWHASAQYVQILVRARTSREARLLSIDILKEYLVSPSVLDTRVVEEIVACDEVVDAGYPAEGVSMVLEVTGQDSEPDVE